MQLGQLELAADLLDEAVRVGQLGDSPHLWGRHSFDGDLAVLRGRPREALQHYAVALELAQAHKDDARRNCHPSSMANDLNIFDSGDWEREMGPARGTRLGPTIGARDLGCSLFEVDPGGQAVPYHAHYANEELLIVLDGVLELRTPEGTREVGRGAVVAFPAGLEGAHRLRNVSDAPARYLLVSTMRFPEVAEQLDTATVLAMKAPGDGWAFPAGSAGDYLALTLDAIKSDPGG